MICRIYRIQFCDPALGFEVTGAHNRLDVSADVKVAFDLYTQWITGGDEVFQDDVDDVLVEDLYVAKGIYVKLQALQLDTTFVRNVRDPDRGEVGKIGKRADGCELRDLEIDFDLTARKLVRKRVKRKEIHLRARRGLNVETLLVGLRQWTFGYGHRVRILTDRMSLQQLIQDLHDLSGLTCKSCVILQSCNKVNEQLRGSRAQCRKT